MLQQRVWLDSTSHSGESSSLEQNRVTAATVQRYTARVGQHRDACLHGSALNEMARRPGSLLTQSICRQGGERGKRDDTDFATRVVEVWGATTAL